MTEEDVTTDETATQVDAVIDETAKKADVVTEKDEVNANEDGGKTEEAEVDVMNETTEKTAKYTQEFVCGVPFTYEHVQRWIRRIALPLFHHHLILCPININYSHWVLEAVITEFGDRKTKHTLTYLDSLWGGPEAFNELMKRYCERSMRTKRNYTSQSPP